MNWERLATNDDWQDFWESPEVRKRLQKEALRLLHGEGDERARGALDLAYTLQHLPAREAERTTTPRVDVGNHTPMRAWLVRLLESARQLSKGVTSVRVQ